MQGKVRVEEQKEIRVKRKGVASSADGGPWNQAKEHALMVL